MIAAPASAAARAVDAFIVSTLTVTPRSASARMTGTTRACSSTGSTRSGARPRRLAADVDDVGALLDQVAGRARSAASGSSYEPAVAERVRRHVEDAHDRRVAHADPASDQRDAARRGPTGSASSPRPATVTVVLPAWRAPRVVTHVCCASSTTSTPRASSPASMVSAICSVRRSCTCGRAASVSTTLRDAAEPDDPLARQVRDVRDAEERQQVVLADRAERDVAQQHGLGRRRPPSGTGRRRARRERVLAEPGEELGVGVGDARGVVARPGTRRILADGGEDLGDGRLDARTIESGHAPPAAYAVAGRGLRTGARFGFDRRLGVDAAVDGAGVDRRLGRDRRSGAGREIGRLSLESHCGRSRQLLHVL